MKAAPLMFVQCDFRDLQKSESSNASSGFSIRVFTAILVALAIFPSNLALASSGKTESAPFDFQIELTVNGQAVSITEEGPLKVPSSHSKIELAIDPSTNLRNYEGARIQYRLREIDTVWQEKPGWMAVGIQFKSINRDEIQRQSATVRGKSSGWNGSPEKSTFTSNQLRVSIPSGAAFASIFITSAGPPHSVGTFIVKGLRLATAVDTHPLSLIEEPEAEVPPDVPGSSLNHWRRVGTIPSMGNRLNLDWLSPPLNAFQIRDNSPSGHCEWVSPIADISGLKPGTEIALTWDEMYNVGLSAGFHLTYAALPPGIYHLDLQATDAFGSPLSIHRSLAFSIPPPFWSGLWFWAFVCSCIIATFFRIRHRVTTNRYRADLAAANEARLIESERMRISRDIHDDLGTRITQISLLSAYTQNDPSSNASQTLTQISLMAKDLVGALHETLWTVNPENDNLNSVSDFICHLAQTLSETAGLRYRVQAQTMPLDRPASSNLRHHIILAVKEALNNAIKHSAASQLTLNIGLIENTLSISICDNGRGFNPQTIKQGLGLKNMHHRMQALNGVCRITPAPTGGTQISFEIPLPK
ncbi:MAG: ATP-binding protein [Verrucomicrobiota bacterium]